MENLRFKLLSPEEIGVICEKCKELLATQGTQVDHPEVLKRVNKAGAQVNFETQQVRLPKDIIEAALKVVPRHPVLGGHSGRKGLPVPHPDGLFYTLINTGARNYLRPGNQYLQTIDAGQYGRVGPTG